MDFVLSRRHFISGGITCIAASVGLSMRDASAIEPIERIAGSRIKLGCCAYSYRKYLTGKSPQMTLLDFIQLCAEMELDGVELTAYYFPTPITVEYLNKVKRTAFLLGIDIAGTAVGNNFCLADPSARKRQVERVKQWIDYAAEMGAPCMRIFAGSTPEGHTEEEAIKWVVECIAECCEHAAKRGVMLALENHGGVTRSAKQLLTIVMAVDSPWFGVNLDTGNFRTVNPYDDIAQVAQYAITSHLKTHVTPRGRKSQPADFARIISILRDANYRGYLNIEYEAREDPRTAIPKLVNQLRALL